LFDNEEGRKIWQSRLQGAIYRASVLLTIFLFLDPYIIYLIFFCKYSEGGPCCLIIFCWHPYNLAFLQGSAAVSSFPEAALPSETNSFKGNFADVVDTEKLFVAGILDELKICFSCGYEVFLS
jgi:vacuolar protein sorting-associated protein 13A/C